MVSPLDQVRLEEFQYKAIVDAFRSFFLPEDSLWLFGSRTNLNARGGDIDLYIETNISTTEEASACETRFLNQVWDIIGDQKIDVVLNMLQSKHAPLAIYKVAKQEGVKLV